MLEQNDVVRQWATLAEADPCLGYVGVRVESSPVGRFETISAIVIPSERVIFEKQVRLDLRNFCFSEPGLPIDALVLGECLDNVVDVT